MHCWTFRQKITGLETVDPLEAIAAIAFFVPFCQSVAIN